MEAIDSRHVPFNLRSSQSNSHRRRLFFCDDDDDGNKFEMPHLQSDLDVDPVDLCICERNKYGC